MAEPGLGSSVWEELALLRSVYWPGESDPLSRDEKEGFILGLMTAKMYPDLLAGVSYEELEREYLRD